METAIDKLNIVVIGGGLISSITDLGIWKKNKCKFILYSSPFSLIQPKIPNSLPVDQNINYELNKNFCADLDNKIDYLIIESSTFTYSLLKKESFVLTKTSTTEKYVDNSYETLNICNIATDSLNKMFTDFFDQIKQKISLDKIIVIKSKLNDYYVDGDTLIKIQKPITDNYNLCCKKCEDILKKIGLRCLDLTVFLSKGLGRLASIPANKKFYEKYLTEMVSDNTKKNVTLSDEDLTDYKINLLSNFSVNDISQKYFEKLFSNNLIDNLIMFSSREFLNKYGLSILEYSKSNLIDDKNSDFYKIVTYYSDLTNNNIYMPTELSLFESLNLKYDELLKVQLCIFCQNLGLKILKRDITKENLEFFVEFYTNVKKDGSNYSNLFKNIVEPHLPMKFDIWGSCYSRLLSNLYPNDIITNKYLFQVNPLSAFDEKVEYDEKLFSDDMKWEDKMIKIQLDSSVEEFFSDSTADWIIFDFYTLLGNRQFYYKGKEIYGHQCDSFEKISKNCEKKLHYKLNDYENVCKKLDTLGNFLKNKYGDNVIVIANSFSEYYLDYDRNISLFQNNPLFDNYKENKAFYDKCVNYFVNKFNFYYIDIVDDYIADENTILNLSPTHYEDSLYKDIVSIIKQIVYKKTDVKIFKNKEKQFPTEQKIDIWGSCISREIFNYTKRYTVSSFLLQNPPHTIFSNSFPLEEDKICFNSNFTKRMAILEFNKKAISYFYDNFKSDYLMIDAADCRNCYYSIIDKYGAESKLCASDSITKTLNSLKINAKLIDSLSIKDNEWENYIQAFCTMLKSRYNQQHIILNKFEYATQYYDKTTNKITNFKNFKYYEKLNELNKKIECLIQKYIPHCLVLDHEGQSIADPDHHLGLYTLHFSEKYYLNRVEKLNNLFYLINKYNAK